jgi:hypothetical protein
MSGQASGSSSSLTVTKVTNMSKPMKFTPEVMASIPVMLANGMAREEIAATIGTTIGSLQVRCSQNGISLRAPGGRCKRQLVKPEVKEEPPAGAGRCPAVGANFKINVILEREALSLLAMRAEKLGTTVNAVAKRLLETIARDNLYDAVVDEEAA